MASVCARFHFSPNDYWDLTVEDQRALADFMLREQREVERANRKTGR